VIRFDLICEHNHEFDSWFASSAAYDEQNQTGLVTCPYCGSDEINKQLMAPSILAKTNVASTSDRHQPMLSANQDPAVTEMVENIRKMRQQVSENAEYVGENFAKEAREIHYEEKPARGIYGKASLDEAKSLLEEGVGVVPLPMLPEENN